MSLLRPVAGRISQDFDGHFDWEKAGYLKVVNGIKRGKRTFMSGAQKFLHLHLAIDYVCPIGTPVKAVHDGKIVAQFVDTDGAVVIYQQIRVGRIFKITAAYWHLKRGSFRFQTGTFVKRGQVIALSGMTGKATGPHLHFELWRSLRGLAVRSLFSMSLRIDAQPFIDGKPLTEVAP